MDCMCVSNRERMQNGTSEKRRRRECVLSKRKGKEKGSGREFCCPKRRRLGVRLLFSSLSSLLVQAVPSAMCLKVLREGENCELERRFGSRKNVISAHRTWLLWKFTVHQYGLSPCVSCPTADPAAASREEEMFRAAAQMRLFKNYLYYVHNRTREAGEGPEAVTH